MLKTCFNNADSIFSKTNFKITLAKFSAIIVIHTMILLIFLCQSYKLARDNMAEGRE